jgi:hypothetical protein
MVTNLLESNSCLDNSINVDAFSVSKGWGAIPRFIFFIILY